MGRPSSETRGVVGEIGAAECWPPARQYVRPRHTFLIAHACLKCRIFSQAPAISGNRNKLRSRSHKTQRGKHRSINCTASTWVSYLNRNLVPLLEKHLMFRRTTWYMCGAFRLKTVQNTSQGRPVSVAGNLWFGRLLDLTWHTTEMIGPRVWHNGTSWQHEETFLKNCFGENSVINY